LDQPLSSGRSLSVHGSCSQERCSTPCYAARVPGGLRRVGDRNRARAWDSGTSCKHLRRDLHVQLIAFGQLPGTTCRFLAVLWRLIRAPRASTLLRIICINETGRTFVHTYLPAVSSVEVNSSPAQTNPSQRNGRAGPFAEYPLPNRALLHTHVHRCVAFHAPGDAFLRLVACGIDEWAKGRA
jgi:hypothetical protein